MRRLSPLGSLQRSQKIKRLRHAPPQPEDPYLERDLAMVREARSLTNEQLDELLEGDCRLTEYRGTAAVAEKDAAPAEAASTLVPAFDGKGADDP